MKTVFIKTLPVLAGYIVLGIGFGILLEEKGYGLPWALAMSLFIYAGSMQYVGVSLIASGAGLITAAITTLAVNARHLFYGISMIDRYKDAGEKKPYLIFALTDETYALVAEEDTPEGVDRHLYAFLISLFDHSYWVLGSCIGAVIGSAFNFNSAGIDFSMTALFITVVVSQWISNRDHFPAITGAVCSIVCLVIFGADRFLIPAMVLISVVLFAARGRYKDRYEWKRREEEK